MVSSDGRPKCRSVSVRCLRPGGCRRRALSGAASLPLSPGVARPAPGPRDRVASRGLRARAARAAGVTPGAARPPPLLRGPAAGVAHLPAPSHRVGRGPGSPQPCGSAVRPRAAPPLAWLLPAAKAERCSAGSLTPYCGAGPPPLPAARPSPQRREETLQLLEAGRADRSSPRAWGLAVWRVLRPRRDESAQKMGRAFPAALPPRRSPRPTGAGARSRETPLPRLCS